MIRINLLPSGKKKVVKLPSTFVYGAIATVLFMVLLAIVTVYMNGRISSMENQIAAKEKRLNQLKVALKEVENYEKDNAEFRRKTQIIEQLKKNQVLPLRLLDEVSEMLPKGVWLTNLTDKAGVVSIDGYAHTNYDLVGYVQNLKGSRYLQDVQLVESRQTTLEDHSLYKFKLTFKMKA